MYLPVARCHQVSAEGIVGTQAANTVRNRIAGIQKRKSPVSWGCDSPAAGEDVSSEELSWAKASLPFDSMVSSCANSGNNAKRKGPERSLDRIAGRGLEKTGASF